MKIPATSTGGATVTAATAAAYMPQHGCPKKRIKSANHDDINNNNDTTAFLLLYILWR